MHRKHIGDFLTKSRASNRTNFSKVWTRPDPVVLAVGEMYEWHRLTRSLPRDATVTFARIDDLTEAYLQQVDPDVVLSCLVSLEFDFLDLARALQAVQYKHFLRIIVPELPDPGIVLSEARSLCPDVNIDFEIDRTGHSTRVH